MIEHLRTFLGVVVCCGGMAVAEAPPPDFRTLMDRGDRAFEADDFEQAVRLFRAAAERLPDDPGAWYSLSRACEEAGDLGCAVASGERVQELGFHVRSRLAYRLARLHARNGNPSGAIEWLRRSLAARYEDRPEIAADRAFAALRDNPKFRRIAAILPDDVSRDDGWRFDLDYLVEEAQRLNPAADRPAFSERFLKEAAAVREAIPGSSDDEILAGLMRLVAILNDGHSAIFGPVDSKLEFTRNALPFKFYGFPDGLYVVAGEGDWASHAGYRVVGFGDLDTATVLERMSAYRGVDNAMTWKWMAPQFYVRQLFMLKAVGATVSGDAVRMTFEKPDGTRVTESVPGATYPLRRKLRPQPAGEPPLYLTRVDTNFWMQPLPGSKALYFQFNQVRDAEDEKIADFAKRLSAALANDDVRTLIVDVRHNNGGNNTLVAPLVRAMIAFDQADEHHRIVVLTGRNTFSAAQNFINRLERWTDAEFAGESSASSPNFVGESTNLTLPFSRVRGSLSSLYWQDSDPGDERAWIPMDLPVELTAADYFAGRDPVLEKVLHDLRPEGH